MIGESLGRYRIQDKLGAGGMGVVYRATDSKLGRQVAIKVLPETYAKDPDRHSRFEREARLLATLNHQNIASIHGLEEAGEEKFLVLEYVPGDTLAERLARARCRSARRSTSAARSPTRLAPRTRPGSSTATSSRPTSRSLPMAR